MAEEPRMFEREQAAIYAVDRKAEMPITVEDASFKTKLFLTGFDGGTAVNHQLNYAFSSDAYTYIFGERLSVISIAGIAFSGYSCDAEAGGGDTDTYSPSQFIKFYNKYKLRLTQGEEQLTPIKFTVSNMIFTGYFIGLKVNLMYQRESFFDFNLTLLGRVTT
jgi:hypothetical protein